MNNELLLVLLQFALIIGGILGTVAVLRAKRYRNADGSIRTYSLAWWTIVMGTPFFLGFAWAYLRPLRFQRRRSK